MDVGDLPTRVLHVVAQVLKLFILPFACFLIFTCWVTVIRGVIRWIKTLIWGEEAQVGRKTVIILGSGGHTREILNLSKALGPNFSPRVYVSTDSDQLSLTKAQYLEQTRGDPEEAKFTSVVRIRDVGQSFVHAFFVRAPAAFIQSTWLVVKERPDVILCNGPGVCVPFCFIATVLNLLCVTNTKIIFVESICRVRTLSMTGRILVHVAHEFIVQWKDLQAICQAQYSQYPPSKFVYLGRLC